MAGHTGLTPDFMQKVKLVSVEDYETTSAQERRVVYVFNTKEELLPREDMVGELVIALDDPGFIFLVYGFDKVCQLKVFRKLRKPLEIPTEENQDRDEE
ncbi:MAG: hypothetical protein GX905_05605 [Bacteroidales bacterium]|nr:hypothetical protein [Bacteroidales bacterium]